MELNQSMPNNNHDVSLDIYDKQLNQLKTLFDDQLHNLGQIISLDYNGIFSPVYTQQQLNLYMTDHYAKKESALSQAGSFDLTDYYYYLISEALNKIKFLHENMDEESKILDIGCGFGSTTIPLLKMFPESEIIASELSIEMLCILKEKLISLDMKKRCTLMQLNAESLDFKDNTFSLIVGAAILHHLLNPEKVFEKIIKILKPGGCAIFFEPFENGMSIMGLIYQSIINNKRFILMKRRHRKYFKSCVSIWQNMKNTNKQDIFFQDKDDKWIFTKSYFNKIFEKFSFNDLIIYPVNLSDKPFLAQAEAHFKGNNIKNLPKWIYKTIESYEEWFSAELKKDFLTEGVIILKK
jgi:ubiquinone/menaquinone biosynthesis C-methylase UbiE